MSYKRNAHLTIVHLPRATYTNFGEPNTHYAAFTNGPGLNVTLKPKANYVQGDRIWFTVRNGNVTFGTFRSGGSSDVVDVSGGSTQDFYYKPFVRNPVKIIMAALWQYESGDTP